jgi:hypothetical protein
VGGSPKQLPAVVMIFGPDELHRRRDVGVMNADVHNGSPADQLVRAAWRKSSYSGKEGNCVELARLPGGVTAVRNSRDPHGPVLIHPANHMAAFCDAVKDGEFDDLPD